MGRDIQVVMMTRRARLAFSLCACAALPAALNSQATVPHQPAGMIADLNRFRDALRDGHPSSPVDTAFDRFFATLVTEAETPRTPVEFYRLVTRLVARTRFGRRSK